MIVKENKRESDLFIPATCTLVFSMEDMISAGLRVRLKKPIQRTASLEGLNRARSERQTLRREVLDPHGKGLAVPFSTAS
jgi:hypothetical protein